MAAEFVKTIYRAVVPDPIRLFVYKWRNPVYRLELKLSESSRTGIETFLDEVSAEGRLQGNVLEVGAGGRTQNTGRFAKTARNYWRTDLAAYTATPYDLLCDCTRLPFKSASLDAIICSEVLEHVLAMTNAAGELARVVAPDGYLVLTIPFFYPLHGLNKSDNGDFWRLSPSALKSVFGKHWELAREKRTHLFSEHDGFVTNIGMLWKRKRDSNSEALTGLSGT